MNPQQQQQQQQQQQPQRQQSNANQQQPEAINMDMRGGGGAEVVRLQKSYAMTAPSGYVSSDSTAYEAFLGCLGSCFGTIGSIPYCCFCFPNPFKEVDQGSVGLVTRFGRFIRAVDPGLYKINVLCEQMIIIDVRMQVQDVPRQVVITKDNVQVGIDSVLYYDILDPFVARFQVGDVQKALIDRTQTTLRMVMGGKTLQETIEHRDLIATEIRGIIDSTAETWGVRVESILLKDVILSPDLLANMSAAATQKRLGESKVIQAQAEVNSAKLMREAADILASPGAMQIRYLETMVGMSQRSGNKVIFVPSSLDPQQKSSDAPHPRK